ncbi:unnamed protein product [Candida verbasci]|uniref:Exosome complex component CSL4 C-terminal domain-containing protein n=1 Tax=Candida verbasci TaxID=1227364 RepID=A0A9W4TUF5_9ASCO|nr:unnamed protein product [Candida verbasci]
MSSSTIVVPGQYITPTYKLQDNKQINYQPGRGTTIAQIETGDNLKIPIISSTILGSIHYFKIDDENIKVNVIPKGEKIIEENDISNGINLPKENDVVLVKINRITKLQIYCEILSIENKGNILKDSGIGSNGSLSHESIPAGGGSQHNFNIQTIASSQSTQLNSTIFDLGENFKGIIRLQDIKSTNRDKIKIEENFKPGDIVRAIIISLGDGTNYYLSTSRNDLGVVFAKSENGSGNLMYPIDWQNMIDIETGLIEKRKNANPFI